MTTFSATIHGDVPVLVDFYTDRSGPCKSMLRILEEVKPRVGDGVRILKVNIDKNPQAVRAYRIQSVPALLLFRKGKLQWRWSGIVLADELLRILQPIEHFKTAAYESHQS